MNIRMLRRFVLPAVLCAQLALLPLPAAGQSGAGADDPQRVADMLADELVSGMREHSELLRQRVALQPLDPKEFVALDKRERRRLHDLLVGSLRSEIRGSYDLADPSNFAAIARILEGRGESDWLDRYMELFRKAEAQINITCTASPSSPGKFEVSCKAFTMEPSENRGTGKGEFSKDWLAAPMDPDWALASIAEEIVAYMQGVGGLDRVTSVDSKEKAETVLSVEVAKMLRDKFSEKRRSWPGWRPVDAAKGEAGHRAVVEVQRYEDKLDLRVELYSGAEDTFQTSFRESMHWTLALHELAGVAGERPVAGGECDAGADPGERWLDDEGLRLADWVLLEGDRLESADYDVYRDVMIRAKRYLSEHCEWEAVAKILDAAITGVATVLKAEIVNDARRGLARLVRVEASAGKHLKLLELRAQAHKSLGERREQDRAYSEWLEVALRTHPRRLDILKTQREIRVEIKREDDERALGLDGRERNLVRKGLSSLGHDAGEGPAEFDEPFREELRSWQASNGRLKTGYLTAEQAKALMAEGEAVEERKRDDEAFARAKAENTATAYEAYLSKFPEGRYVEEARRRLEAIRAREDDAAFARAKRANTEASYAAYLSQYPDGRHAAEARRLRKAVRVRDMAAAEEATLGLTREQRVLVERGLAAWKAGGGAVDGRFDAAFRGVLRSWQASKGHLDTGYLTAEQAQALMAEGVAAEAQENDDRAFARAKAADTAEAYETYLSEYPNGRHVAEARRLLEAIHDREDDAAFARAKRADTEAAYAAYLSQYPDGRHAAEARRLRETARVREAAAAQEEALRLTLAERALVERGLASRVRSGTVDGRFDERFRAAFRSWQASRGDAATGYLTRGQADVLIARGREVEERERDDTEFARAKSANTAAAYEAYLRKFPKGRHAAEARRRLNAIRAEEKRLKQEQEAERLRLEKRLEKLNREREQCMATDRSWLTKGSLFCDCAECPVMVVGKSGVAASKYPVLPFEWNACIEDRDCGKFRSRRPADRPMPLSLEQAQTYVRWLSRKTGKDYRLLTESHRSGGLLDDDTPDALDDGLLVDDSLGGDSLGGPGYRVARNVGRTAGGAAAAAEKRLGLSGSDRMRIQRALNAGGFDAGGVDGVFGQRTRKALRAWQASSGYARTGYLTASQAAELIAAGRGASREPGRRFRACEGSWCPELVVVPSGTFMMGSPESESGRRDREGPRHRVRIGKAFAVGVTEVTRGEFGRFVHETGHSTGDRCRTYEDGEWDWRSGVSWRKPGYSQTDGHPVVCVSWEDAQAYVRWLSSETGGGYRLLSESEWEYVARGGTRTSRNWGTGETGQCGYANGADRALKRRYGDWEWPIASCDDGHVHTAPVRSYVKNGFGLYDVMGNVWEWVEDCWNEDYTGAPSNGSAWESGDCGRRVLRGGSWYYIPRYLRSAFRIRNSSGFRFNYAGFRIARTLD